MKFVDPPITHAGRSAEPKYLTRDIQAALKQRPNEWALVFESSSVRIRSAVHHYCTRRPWFETTVRTAGRSENGEALFDIYVRYNPEAAR